MSSPADMFHPWRSLIHQLMDSDEAEEQEWCRTEGVPYSLPARLARLILHPHFNSSSGSRGGGVGVSQELSPGTGVASHDKSPAKPRPPLPRPSERDDVWTELLEWRHPRIHLNLLQLAVVFLHEQCIQYLWQPIFTREENYQGECTQLLNHPLHLGFRLHNGVLLQLVEDINDKLFYEKGTVNLTLTAHPTETPVRWPPSKSKYSTGLDLATPAHCGSSFDKADDDCLVQKLKANSSLAAEDMRHCLLPATGTPVTLPRTLGVLDVVTMVTLTKRKLLGAKAQPSTVQRLWGICRDLSARGMTARVYSYLITYMDASPLQCDKDSLILGCQLSWAVVEKEALGDQCMEAVNYLIRTAVHLEVPIGEAASCLSNHHLDWIVTDLTMRYKLQRWRSGHIALKYRAAARLLKDLRRERTLQNLCMLRILKSVKGDARLFRSLPGYPVPLKELLHVPYEELYEKLQSERLA